MTTKQPRQKPSEKRRARQEAAAEEQERRAPVQGRTPGQRRYLQAIKQADVTVCYGPQGTGKTFIPAAYAAELMQVGEIDQIVLCRPMVEAGDERMGALPGGINQKMDPWTAPVIDVLERKLGRGVVAQKRAEGKIVVVPFAFMRGRTFDRAFVIADEMQNATPAMAKLLTGRIGEGTRVVISGDLGQCDLNVPRSGLEAAAAIVERYPELMEGCRLIKLGAEDIVRSAQCRRWYEGWAKLEGWAA